jgi:hypothetical protein
MFSMRLRIFLFQFKKKKNGPEEFMVKTSDRKKQTKAKIKNVSDVSRLFCFPNEFGA